ncbi:methyltransferase domain-containing protein [Methylopila henanensis]|uniref:Methyltransferase domain-containing protein n=1 Tax=Methylopila henanensis TaxID=873516 RepID=A0ABW4K8C0_9HYPH
MSHPAPSVPASASFPVVPPDQHAHFKANGFSLRRSLLDADETQALSARLRETYLGEQLKFLRNDIANNVPEVTHYIWDPRVVEFVAASIGGQPKFLQASDFQINHNVFGWHRDSPSRKFGGVDWQEFDGPYACVKCILYLDATDFGLGVVPGSHLHPIPVEDVHRYKGETVTLAEGDAPDFGYGLDDWRTVNVVVQPGDALLFDQRLYHRGWPTARRSAEERRLLSRTGQYKYSGGKITLALCYGLDNFHSHRYYSAFRFHRVDLKFQDLPPETIEKLDEHDLLLSSMGRNLFEDDETASQDLYSSLKMALAVEKLPEAEDVVFETPPATRADGRIKGEALTRPFIRFHRQACPACGSSEPALTSNYPSGNQEFFANLTVHGCADCGFAFVPNRVLGLSRFRRRAAPEGALEDPAAIARFRPDHSFAAAWPDVTANLDGRTVLDIACGYGAALAEFAGARRVGVEFDPEIAAVARAGGVETVSRLSQVEPGSVDIVIADRWLESLPPKELLEELKEARPKLKPDGALLLKVSNASLLRLNAKRARHSPNLSFFSARSLRATLKKAGYGATVVRSAGEDFQLHRAPIHTPAEPDDDVRGEWLMALARPAPDPKPQPTPRTAPRKGFLARLKRKIYRG